MTAPATFKRGGLVCVAVCAMIALLVVFAPASNIQPQNLAGTIVALDSPHSPMKLCRNSNGRLPHCDMVSFPSGMQTQPQFLDSLRSLDIGMTQSICLALSGDTGAPRILPIDLASLLRLSFRHSIYGSLVEELFALRRDGFLLTQIRYGEARLVDFYGYENADLENGAWVVNPPPVLLPSLSLNASADGAMSLQLDRHGHTKPLAIQTTGALRLTIASCRNNPHG